MPDNLRRREQIINLLCDQGSVRVESLNVHFGVSSVAIRSNLRYLEQKGCVMRSYDGTVLNQHFALGRPLQDKDRLNHDVKMRVAERTASFMKDGDTSILDSGSVTTLTPPILKSRRDLVVMTSALNIAWELADFERVDIMILGGDVRQSVYSLYGPSAKHQFGQYRSDKFFLGVDGFCLEVGITTPHPGKAHLNQVMCEVAQEVTAIADSSKSGHKSFCIISEISGIGRVITDSGIPGNYHRTLIQLGMDVVIADE